VGANGNPISENGWYFFHRRSCAHGTRTGGFIDDSLTPPENKGECVKTGGRYAISESFADRFLKKGTSRARSPKPHIVTRMVSGPHFFPLNAFPPGDGTSAKNRADCLEMRTKTQSRGRHLLCLPCAASLKNRFVRFCQDAAWTAFPGTIGFLFVEPL